MTVLSTLVCQDASHVHAAMTYPRPHQVADILIFSKLPHPTMVTILYCLYAKASFMAIPLLFTISMIYCLLSSPRTVFNDLVFYQTCTSAYIYSTIYPLSLALTLFYLLQILNTVSWIFPILGTISKSNKLNKQAITMLFYTQHPDYTIEHATKILVCISTLLLPLNIPSSTLVNGLMIN